MREALKITAAAAILIGLGACASKPKTVETAVTEPEAAEVVETVDTTPVATDTVREVATSTVAPGPRSGSLEDFRVNVGERVYYDLNGYRLDSDDQQILQRQAAWLNSHSGVRIMVAGNCDERGTREYNLALGERRAAIVKDYLVSLGVDGARIETVSYGKERPIADGADEQAWALNRNGFTQIVSGASS